MKVVLGVCGGVAAYKAAELVRELQRRGAEVQVVMTAGAERFITPLTFAALSGRQVLTSIWQPAVSEIGEGAFDIEHIRIAQDADVIVIAPATANVIAKLAHGITDDLLTTVCLATTAPMVLAPAMNVNMWHHDATQKNVDTLRKRGADIVEPGAGLLACGMVGEGRLADVLAIADAVMRAGEPVRDLAGETVLITAGGTREPIDAVRFIGNRSSGKMGVALADAAIARGATVLLIHTTNVNVSRLRCEMVSVTTAAEMQQAVMEALPRATVVVMAAAVSDYRVASPSAQKVKKMDSWTLELVRNDDILKQVGQQRQPGTVVIGFAAETDNVAEEGLRKLHEKGADAIVANDVSRTDRGFDSDCNSGLLIAEDGNVDLPLSSKREMAEKILDWVVKRR